MSIRNTIVVLALVTTACGSTQRPTATYRYAARDPATMVDVDVRPGPMPEGESFTGSYSSTQIGDVFFEQTGDAVIGQYAYNRGNCRATGRIEGTAQGNLLRFTWTESQAACGRLAPMRGRGWFLFWKDSSNNGRFNGEWGTGENDTGGGPWSGFRDRVRRQPPEPPRAPGSGGGIFDTSGSAPAQP